MLTDSAKKSLLRKTKTKLVEYLDECIQSATEKRDTLAKMDAEIERLKAITRGVDVPALTSQIAALNNEHDRIANLNVGLINENDDLRNKLLDAKREARQFRQEVIDIARRCAMELKHSGMIIERLAPKAEAYETLKQVLGLLPRPVEGQGENLPWKLEKRAEELSREPERVQEA